MCKYCEMVDFKIIKKKLWTFLIELNCCSNDIIEAFFYLSISEIEEPSEHSVTSKGKFDSQQKIM